MMQHLKSLSNLNLKSSWVTIGSFDGVHLGHRSIIDPLVKNAHASDASAVVLTFFPHPSVVLRGIKNPIYLTTPQERADLMADLGVDVVITLKFDQQLSQVRAYDFMKECADHLGLKKLWVGQDFALGRNREGNVSYLKTIGPELGYDIQIAEPFTLDQQTVSSSLIRQKLIEGDVASAQRYLGRPYRVMGKIIHGDGRGHQLGFPTANLSSDDNRLLPLNGVYASMVWLGETAHPAVTNIGLRPTFDQKAVVPRVETHLLDIQKDLYGQEIKLDFIKFIRPELRFSSIQGLVNQVQLDIQTAREILNVA